MNRVKFISIDFLKEYSPLARNIDEDILIPYVYKAQDINLQQLLGSTFYTRLKAGVVANDLNADEEALIRDYIQNMLVEWTLYYALPNINYKYTNKSVTQDSSEFGTPSALEEVKYLRQNVRDMAEFYSKRLSKFLCDNGNRLFPEYAQESSTANLPKKNRSYFSGVYVPRLKGTNFVRKSWNEPFEGDDYNCC